MSRFFSLQIFLKVQLNSLEWRSVILDGCIHQVDACQDPQETLLWGWVFFDFFLEKKPFFTIGSIVGQNRCSNVSLIPIANFSKSSIKFSGVEIRHPWWMYSSGRWMSGPSGNPALRMGNFSFFSSKNATFHDRVDFRQKSMQK